MINTHLRDSFQDLISAAHEEKLEMALRGFVTYFRFSRASLFAYSPLTYKGEGLLRIEKDTIYRFEEIREDVRSIPPVYSAITGCKPEFVPHCINHFPIKYVKQFELSSLVVVPITRANTILGAALVDRYEGEEAIEELLPSLFKYGRVVGEIIAAPGQKQKTTPLSNRETEVLQRMSLGESIKQMADHMRISEFTVRDYIKSAMRKMGVQHRAQAVAEAMRQGIIE
ncbi:response regulator transcription factor [Effusibacillus lacus]|uniref:Helix-turn-helix transcriptional regulator n=1 Tax=Effusibacillus lacus TaxID=1348429 RepID=A0A292YHL7_9BACL|nr:LuxR C-terminal-related transcriptional regulator [Effusibacillus lacus]TCS72837.1 regulatory LuxR family protein [Effusibacillus lacus]GAX89238.1 helix-turn-helix transcriptional regulator [Effusibacillus lacus]